MLVTVASFEPSLYDPFGVAPALLQNAGESHPTAYCMSLLSLLSSVSVFEPSADAPRRAAELLRQARRVLVMTGAGMSADSGLPTYRGVGGLYDDRGTDDGISIEEALSAPMFERNPALTWRYIAEVERACRGAGPNAGHRVLADFESRYERFTVLTQNVDGFHGAAGSRDVIEMHGNVHRLFCVACGQGFEVDDFSTLGELPPHCESCGGLVRPATVLFGEMLPEAAVARYDSALAEGFDLVVSIGTSALFPYIAGPIREAGGRGAATIEINPSETEVSRFCDVVLRSRAEQALVGLYDAVSG